MAAGTDLEKAPIVMEFETPANGDVLITTEGGRHLLSVVPYPHRLSLSQYPHALQIARAWAAAYKVRIWRDADGELTEITRETVGQHR